MTFAGHKVALITGASSGLGAEFAKEIAKKGTAVVLVARRRDRLEALASEISASGGVAHIISCDLFNKSERKKLSSELAKYEVDLMINNAGYGKAGAFADMSLDDVLGQIELNISALTELTYYAIHAFRERKGSCGIINIASTAAFAPIPFFSVYSATKSYVRDFTESLREELKDTSIRVAVVCPGATDTEFFDRAGKTGLVEARKMSAHKCVSIAMSEYEAGQNHIVTGALNKATHIAAAMVPRQLSMFVAKKIMEHEK